MGRFLPLLAALALPAILAALGVALPRPFLLLNTSPSEPVGLYVRAGDTPRVGSLAAFHTPPRGAAYARSHLPELIRGSILKRVVAGPGEGVCVRDGQAWHDGRRLGPVYARDARGDRLPQWSGCRRLGPAEYFVFSGRIWNSFDSRYYGPVSANGIIGTYAPIWVEATSAAGGRS